MDTNDFFIKVLPLVQHQVVWYRLLEEELTAAITPMLHEEHDGL